GLRRLVVNALYSGLRMDVPQKADVSYVGEYKPTPYGFKGYRKGVRPEEHNLSNAIGAATETKIISKGMQAEKAGLLTAGGPLELKKDDHIALVGNALPDRMQHFGYLETLIYARNPKLDLIFRNLAVAGDEVVLRHRSENFGTPEEWLHKVKADVVFAFFGFNESFKGKDGLEQFKTDLDKYLKELKSKDFSGKGPPR